MGGDYILFLIHACINSFNPRLRMGGDLAVLLDSHLLDVSIHASAWEATTH